MNLTPFAELAAKAMATDPVTRVFYLDLPREHIVLLQAFFELYDGIGTVRTLDPKAGIVCLMTTDTLVNECAAVLLGIRDTVHWRTVECADHPLGTNIET